MTLGLVSDTHNLLDPRVMEAFAGVDRILHAGDVCRPQLISKLEAIAPVTVVLGNNDSHPDWRATEILEVDGSRILIRHIVVPEQFRREFVGHEKAARPSVVVFGHTHRPYCETIGGILFLNPGSAGPPRFGLPRSVCRLRIEGAKARPEFIDLGQGG